MENQLRFIVFLIDSRCIDHDGYIFSNIKDAREYAHDALTDEYCTSVIIASFIFGHEQREMMIHEVEKINAKAWKKNKKTQLDLFK
ncbi:MAG: hypothetical protein RBS07_07690 [Lentimicrobium sp.]|jgi:hypothetical protein|nr:hypothetical protein [Lentimicrobium sp.]